MFYGYGYDRTYILVIIGGAITMVAQALVNGSYSKYKMVRDNRGVTGREVARTILALA